MARIARLFPAVIPAAGSLSAAVQLRGWEVVAVIMPAAWTAAGITFQVSNDGVVFHEARASTGAETTLTVAVDQRVSVPAAALTGAREIRVRSGTAAVPVVQAAERTVELVAVRQ